MDLSIKETAQLLGKSERQIRYMIKKGELVAAKKDSSWKIVRESLPFSDRQILNLNRKRAIFTDTVDKVVDTLKTKRQYTFTDLRTFQLAFALYRDFTKEPHLRDKMEQVFDHLASGYHCFDHDEKIANYKRARQCLCQLAVALFLAHQDKPQESYKKATDIVEQEIIPSLGGLIRSLERKERYRRAVPL